MSRLSGPRIRQPERSKVVGDPRLLLSRAGLTALALSFAGVSASGLEVSLASQTGVYITGLLLGGTLLWVSRDRHLAVGSVRSAWTLTAGIVLLAATLALPSVGFLVALVLLGIGLGLADLRTLEGLGLGEHLQTRGQGALAVVVRGGVVLAVPVFVDPGEFTSSIQYLLAPVGVSGSGLAVLGEDGITMAIGGLFVALLTIHLALGLLRGRGRSWRLEAAETLILVAFFVWVPPITATGLYVGWWYGLRQTVRPGRGDLDGRGSRGIRSVLQSTLWLLAIGLVLAPLLLVLAGPASLDEGHRLLGLLTSALAVLGGPWLLTVELPAPERG